MPFDVSDFPGAPREDRVTGRHNRILVGTWLFAVAFMVLVMIVLGGVTRLTGSGLSIMEWAPFAGALPPLSNAEWQRLFHLYQQVPQYALVNEGFGLAGFKQIFWLEWIHRLWGRLIGFAFLIPLICFWATGRIERRLRPKLVLLFVLGGLQGAVGWFMVASGFFPESTAVSPYRLVIHLALALILYSALVWTGLSVLRPVPQSAAVHRPLHRMAWIGCSVTGLTMLAGGFVAGTHAGFDYNTFPFMDGRLLPDGYAALRPFVRNLTENIPAVQFDHRLLGTVTVLVIVGTVGLGLVRRPPRPTQAALIVLGIAAALQYTLGVETLLLVVPVALAALHQAVATLLLTGEIVLLHMTRSVPIRSIQ
jgi:cytochrome c oxidase assembly protein subunit 15